MSYRIPDGYTEFEEELRKIQMPKPSRKTLKQIASEYGLKTRWYHTNRMIRKKVLRVMQTQPMEDI